MTPRKRWARKGATAAELDNVRHDLTILEQATELNIPRGPGGFNFDFRDRSMAANTQWILDHQPRGTRIVVWAPNAHIASRLASLENMGGYLRKQLKSDYISLGFLFSQGSFQARDRNRGNELNEITLGDPPEFHASVAFARTGKPLLVLDLRSLPKRGVVHDWFASPHPVREIGSTFFSEKSMTNP